jgi:predicted DNA-binding protein YlxM (UPF0122 family)
MLKYMDFYNNFFRIYLFLILIFNIGSFIFFFYFNKTNYENLYINNFYKINEIINDINLLKKQININKKKINNYKERFNNHKKKLKLLLSINKESNIYNNYKILIKKLKNKGIFKLNKTLIHLLIINCDI